MLYERGELDLEDRMPEMKAARRVSDCLPRAADADEHRVAARVVDDARDARDVLHRLVEEHEVHDGELLVVLAELALEHLRELVVRRRAGR